MPSLHFCDPFPRRRKCQIWKDAYHPTECLTLSLLDTFLYQRHLITVLEIPCLFSLHDHSLVTITYKLLKFIFTVITRFRGGVTRHRKANRLDPIPFTQLLPLCLHFMTKNKNMTLTELRVPDHYEFLVGLRCWYTLSLHQAWVSLVNWQRRSIIGQELWETQTDRHTDTHTHTQTNCIYNITVAIGIPLLPPTLYAGVKHHRPWSVLGWVTVVVCQFLLIVLRMRL